MLKLFIFLSAFLFLLPLQSAAQTNVSHRGKFQDSLREIYNSEPLKRPQIEELLHKGPNADQETRAFLEVLKIGTDIDNRTESELDKFSERIGVKYKAYPNVQARAYRTIGYHYFIGVANYEKAFNAYLKLEKLLTVYDESVITDYANYCGELLTAYYKFKNYKSAIKIGKIGLTKATNKWYMYNTLGLCFTELHQHKKALAYLNQAVKEAEEKKMPPIYKSIALGNIGNIHYLNKEYAKAKPLLEIDYQEAIKSNDLGLAAGAAIPLGDILAHEGKWAEANQLLSQARDYIVATGQHERLERLFPVISRYYERRGNIKDALNYRDSAIKAIKRNDSVFNGLLVMRAQQKTDLEGIAEEKNKLESYKKLSQTRFIAIMVIFIIAVVFVLMIRRYNNRIERDKKRIEELNRIMEIRQSLSADMHDDVGSTLSSISIYTHSLLMQEHSAESKGVLEKIKLNAQAVQENISDIIWSVNPKMDNMEHVISRMRTFGADITEYANIKFDFEVDAAVSHLPLNMVIRKNIYLIYKEAINNAVKYSGASEIKVKVQLSDAQLLMEVSDNGCGFDWKMSAEGNGLVNMKFRAEEIRAAINIDTTEGVGTVVRLLFNETTYS